MTSQSRGTFYLLLKPLQPHRREEHKSISYSISLTFPIRFFFTALSYFEVTALIRATKSSISAATLLDPLGHPPPASPAWSHGLWKNASSTSINGRLKQLTNSVSHVDSNTGEKIGKCLSFQRSLRKPLNQLYEKTLVEKKKQKMEIPKIKKFLCLVHDQLPCSKGGLVIFYPYSFSTSNGYDKFDIHHPWSLASFGTKNKTIKETSVKLWKLPQRLRQKFRSKETPYHKYRDRRTVKLRKGNHSY